MKYCWSTITVKDMDESILFYRDLLGLKLNQRYPAGPGTEIAFLGEGETKIELICSNENKPNDQGLEGISLGFEVESLEAELKRINDLGYQRQGEVIKPNPKVQFFFLRDPNGIKIQFVEHL